MRPKTLYLGLDPPPNVLHYPVIRTQKIDGPELAYALSLWPQFTHILLTSKTTVRYLPLLSLSPVPLCIGQATANALSHPSPLIAPIPTQEGIIALIESLSLSKPFFFFPKSKLSRPLLSHYLTSRNIPFHSLDLYDTLFQAPHPIPSLDTIDEIVFTSSSTVEGFLRIYSRLPKEKKLTAIGPVTQKALDAYTER